MYVVLLKEEDNFFIFYKVYPLGYILLHKVYQKRYTLLSFSKSII